MSPVRRPFLLTPGEAMLLNHSCTEVAVRFSAFVAESGLPPQAILSSTLCALPLPVFVADFGTHPDGRPRRRWEGTRAEFMWHPLMWLPSRVANRYSLTMAGGTTRIEDDDLWAIRVSFEMTASGLYDPTTGTWLDILNATVGLDVDNDVDLARVQEWLDGADDDLLDSIDLTDFLDVPPTSWALESALDMRETLECASWALMADSLYGLVDDTIAPGNGLSNDDMLLSLRAVAGMAEALLAAVPPVVVGASPEDHSAFFARIHSEIDLTLGIPDNFTVADYLGQSRDRLFEIREAYWPYVEGLGRFGNEPAPV